MIVIGLLFSTVGNRSLTLRVDIGGHEGIHWRSQMDHRIHAFNGIVKGILLAAEKA